MVVQLGYGGGWAWGVSPEAGVSMTRVRGAGDGDGDVAAQGARLSWKAFREEVMMKHDHDLRYGRTIVAWPDEVTQGGREDVLRLCLCLSAGVYTAVDISPSVTSRLHHLPARAAGCEVVRCRCENKRHNGLSGRWMGMYCTVWYKMLGNC